MFGSMQIFAKTLTVKTINETYWQDHELEVHPTLTNSQNPRFKTKKDSFLPSGSTTSHFNGKEQYGRSLQYYNNFKESTLTSGTYAVECKYSQDTHRSNYNSWS
eukprot:TRINITY_DN1177_c0_g2_i5.p1 TRINITY_DN1177_c0_g2~~TRINITY_DN1177_c0_g2_i5.p1  ORF type:complete len:104 (+),score=5.94 TRINITY_DN1177_c0_g2_i5:123-434(+)